MFIACSESAPAAGGCSSGTCPLFWSADIRVWSAARQTSRACLGESGTVQLPSSSSHKCSRLGTELPEYANCGDDREFAVAGPSSWKRLSPTLPVIWFSAEFQDPAERSHILHFLLYFAFSNFYNWAITMTTKSLTINEITYLSNLGR